MAKPAYFVDVPDSVSVAGGGLNYQVNGRLNPALLRQVVGGGYAHIQAAPHYEAMARDFSVVFANQGWQLGYTGIYRTFQRQEQMLFERYTTTPRPTSDTNYYQGKTWYLKPGYAQAATPGTSNHGWGLAWDLAIRLETGGIVALTSTAVAWLRAHAGRYGFVNEVSSENWHWTYCWGDLTPPYLQGQPGGYDPWRHQYGDFPTEANKPQLQWLTGFAPPETVGLQKYCKYFNDVVVFEAGQKIKTPYEVFTGDEYDDPNTPAGEQGSINALRNLNNFFNADGHDKDLAFEAYVGVCGPAAWRMIDALATRPR